MHSFIHSYLHVKLAGVGRPFHGGRALEVSKDVSSVGVFVVGGSIEGNEASDSGEHSASCVTNQTQNRKGMFFSSNLSLHLWIIV